MLFALIGKGGHVSPLSSKELEKVDFTKLMLKDTGVQSEEKKKKREKRERDYADLKDRRGEEEVK